MRNIILAIFIFATTSLFAQKFEIGLNGGVAFNNAPSGSYSRGFWEEDCVEKAAAANNPVVSLRALYNYKKWQLGVDAGFRQVRYSYAFYQDGYAGFFLMYKTTRTEQLLPLKLLISRKFTCHRFENYVGLSAGCILRPSAETVTIPQMNSLAYPHKYGLTAGVNAGSTYFITKKLGINAEVATDYMPITMGQPGTGATKISLHSFQATLGIRYKF